MAETSSVATALCAQHREPMLGTCSRCGAFTCARCQGPGPADGLCEACRLRLSQAATFSWAELVAIARAQRHVLLALLASLLLFPASMYLPKEATAVLSLGVAGARVWLLYRLCRALRLSGAWALTSLCGWLGILALLVLSNRATKALKQGGIQVGLFGANPPESRPG